MPGKDVHFTRVHKEAVPECYEVVSVLHEKALSGSRMPEVVLYDL